MGTRSLTHVLDEDGTILATIYRQMDGYPSGIGYEIADFLADRVIVNGIGAPRPKASNGMGCLAASLVASLKDGIGSVYLMAPGSVDHGEEFVYSVTLTAGHLNLRCDATDECGAIARTLYDGPPEDFRAMVKEEAR